MEQKQIYTFCKEHEIDLAPIILKQKTWTEPSENLVLYHGSKERIIGDIKTVTRSEYDFGKGFYMGTTTPQPLTLVYA